MKENQQVARSKQAKRSTSSHYMEPNYRTLILDVVDIKGSRHLATLGAQSLTQPAPQLQQKLGTGRKPRWTLLSDT